MKSIENDLLSSKVVELETRLSEAEGLIEAIKAGEVDAFAILNNNAPEVYTLQSGDYAYRVLVEKFNEGALNLTEEGLIVYSNAYFFNLLGIAYEKVLGTSIYKYISEDSLSSFKELFNQALHGHSKGELNLNINGKIASVYVSLTSLQPNLATIGMIVTNLTEKKTNELIISGYQNELIEKNRLLLNKNKQLEQRIFKEFSESFSEYVSGDEFFHSLTQSLAQKTNLDFVFIGELTLQGIDQYLVKTISLTAHGNLVDNIQYPLPNGPCEQVIRGTLYSYPDQCRITFPKNQTLIDFEVEGYIGYPLFDTNKVPIGLIAVMHRNKIEDVEFTESLVKIAARRTEIEMERLRNEKVMAAKNVELQNQNAELASFSYIASHDLQEPLRKIQAFTSRIMQKEGSSFTATGIDYFRRITEAAARMQSLIEALLSYSRTNMADIKLITTDLNLILEEVKKDLDEEIREKGVTFQTSPLPVLKVVPVQFYQLFLNFITNSIKYINPGIKPHLVISADVVSASEINTKETLLALKYWKISFSDNGIGFESQHEGKVFELFQRLHGKSEYAGTGIGLAICKKIMHNHKGIITATGNPGVGATFSIYIPVVNEVYRN